MATVLAAAIYSRIGFSPCLAVHERRVRVPGGSAFHLEPGTIDVNYAKVKDLVVDFDSDNQCPILRAKSTGACLNV